MPIIELYSKRKKRALAGAADVYQYDSVPLPLRNQIIHIWGDALGIPYVKPTEFGSTEAVQGMFLSIASALRREYGVVSLHRNHDPNDRRNAYEEVVNWFRAEADADRVLDGIELTFRLIDHFKSEGDYLKRQNGEEIFADAIEELNARFKEHGAGYQFSDRCIVRIDSAFIHTEAVVPTLIILRQKEYASAQSEFLSAFEHFRHGNKAEVLVDCCKAFESTMKVICDKRGWAYPPGATAATLVKVCLDNGLIPSYWQTHFTGLRSVLESAIPTPRNRQAGHGSGSNPRPELPDELVSYILHMTASTILFLAEADEAR